ncbi:MAG: hypothetical protein H6740_10210 [Alphaproteobacteria bacterium]|nr:hypothetical protein [Alphaproteobacteria bacterium]
MSLLLLLLAQALAAPLLVRISDPEQRMRDPIAGLAEGAGAQVAFAPVDDGTPPDVVAGDGIRSVIVQAPDASELVLTLTDDRGEVWTGTVTLEAKAQLDLDLRVLEDGRLEAYTPLGPSGGDGGANNRAGPRGAPELDGAGARTLPWALAFLGWAGVIGLLWARERRPRLGGVGEAPPVEVRVAEGLDAEALLIEITEKHRALWVGPLPTWTAPPGTLFEGARELAALEAQVRALQGRGRPLVVVLAAPVQELEGQVSPEALRARLNRGAS